MMAGREQINVERARKLYDQLGSWPAVARILRRKSGQPFTPGAIAAAVRWDDLGNAGRRSPQITSMREILNRLPSQRDPEADALAAAVADLNDELARCAG